MNNHSTFKSGLFLIALTASSQAFALESLDDGNQSAYISSFKALDTDSDGTLNKTEVKKEKIFSKHFGSADKNSDGTLDQQEYTDYKVQSEQSNMKRVTSDTMITSKVKGNLLKDEGLKSLEVSVKTNHGVVLLSGFVETEDQIKQAETIARETEGVKSVKNSLLLKKQ
jgi:hyperosmotically inducible protein